MARSELVQSLLRGLDILEAVARNDDGLRLADVAGQLGLKAPTAHNLLRTLESRGFLARRKHRYVAGPALKALLWQEGERRLAAAAEAAVRNLARLLPHTVVLFSRPAGPAIVPLWRWDPDARVLQSPAPEPHHPYGSASGLAFQAFCDADLRARVRLHYPFHEYAAHLWPSPDALDAFLDQVRDTGVCVPSFPRMVLLLAAAPVWGPGRELKGTVGAATQRSRVSGPDEQARFISCVRSAAESLCEDGRPSASLPPAVDKETQQ